MAQSVLKKVIIMVLHCIALNFHQSMPRGCRYLRICLALWMCPPCL